MVGSLPFGWTLICAVLLASYQFLSTRMLQYNKYKPYNTANYWVKKFDFYFNINTIGRWVVRILMENIFIDLMFSIIKLCPFSSPISLGKLYVIIVVCRIILYTTGQYLCLKINYRRK